MFAIGVALLACCSSPSSGVLPTTTVAAAAAVDADGDGIADVVVCGESECYAVDGAVDVSDRIDTYSQHAAIAGATFAMAPRARPGQVLIVRAEGDATIIELADARSLASREAIRVMEPAEDARCADAIDGGDVVCAIGGRLFTSVLADVTRSSPLPDFGGEPLAALGVVPARASLVVASTTRAFRALAQDPPVWEELPREAGDAWASQQLVALPTDDPGGPSHVHLVGVDRPKASICALDVEAAVEVGCVPLDPDQDNSDATMLVGAFRPGGGLDAYVQHTAMGVTFEMEEAVPDLTIAAGALVGVVVKGDNHLGRPPFWLVPFQTAERLDILQIDSWAQDPVLVHEEGGGSPTPGP